MISFKAQKVGNVYIEEKLFLDIYQDKRVSVIKFDKNSKHDKHSLSEIARDWKSISGHKKTFANDIYDEFVESADKKDEFKRLFYGITLQEENFEKIDPSKVLGLAEVSHIKAGTFDDSEVKMLDLLQTIPNNISTVSFRKYRLIGKRMLDFVIGQFKKFPIAVVPTKTSKGFYIKNGFQFLNNIDVMILRR